MRVALLSANAPIHNAIGNSLAQKVRFFQERGAEVRLFVEDTRGLHPDLHSCCVKAARPGTAGPVWDYLCQADLVLAQYAQDYELLQYLPCLAGGAARIVLEYHGITPPHLWPATHRQGLHTSQQQRGMVWCADHALVMSTFSRRELQEATQFPSERITTLPLPVDTRHFLPGPRERFLHQRLGLQGRIVLYVGRLAGNKRVPLLIEALARVEDPSLHAVLVGAADDVYAQEAQRCRGLARQLGVARQVHLLGQVDDAELPRVYRSADVLVIPSLHEGFCIPVLEAQASGVPVLASRSAALPETVGAAGLTFAPDDADDLAQQLRRVLAHAPAVPAADAARPRRIAVVSFRFGPDIVGGAETSLRTLAHALQDAGHHVEVFTTCTRSESHWRDEAPAGSVQLDGLRVQRFPVDPHDAGAHGAIYRQILEAEGRVTPAIEQAYLQHSLHSTALLAALRARRSEWDALITGPYLLGLSADVVQEFASQTLLVPCFHDEALARLAVWPRLAGRAGGILYHSAVEQHFAQARLGVNHPNSWEMGTCLSLPMLPAPEGGKGRTENPKPYLVYCGRYGAPKNVPLLLAWLQRYQAERADRFDVVFMGQGDLSVPAAPWLRDLGRVEESAKQALLAGAAALIQLSLHESLSLVALEAWAAQTPVIAHQGCAVLVEHIERARGGQAVADYDAFARALDDLWQNPADWQERGTRGRAYVAEHYASPRAYVQCLLGAIDQMRVPLQEQMRQRGLQRIEEFSEPRWQERFGECIESILTQPALPQREEVRLHPLRSACHATAGMRTLLLPVRLENAGARAAAAAGPGRTVICSTVHAATLHAAAAPEAVITRAEMDLPALLMPGQSQAAAVPVALPPAPGTYRLRLWAERKDAGNRPADGLAACRVELPLAVVDAQEAAPAAAQTSCASVFLETVQETLPRTQELQQLPADYLDVTEGTFAPAKRFLKRKLLNNFKQGYVDVLSRQQSQVNAQLVLMVQQLAECCTLLDHAVAGLHQRLDALESRVEQIGSGPAPRAPGKVEPRQHG